MNKGLSVELENCKKYEFKGFLFTCCNLVVAIGI